MSRTYGRSLRGTRLAEAVPYGRWETTTFLGALRSTGFVAPLCVEGAINGALFQAWVEQQLVKVLRPGDVVVMDNLRAHHVPAVREAIERQGAELLFMPPYSPDLNPIELCWSFIKNVARRRKERNPDQLKRAIRNAFLRVRSKMLENWFSHCVPAQPK